jgi:hypothetical protein
MTWGRSARARQFLVLHDVDHLAGQRKLVGGNWNSGYAERIHLSGKGFR